MVAFLYHMENMTSHFNGCLRKKMHFERGTRRPNANQFNFCSACVSSVIILPLWLEIIYAFTVTKRFFQNNSRVICEASN